MDKPRKEDYTKGVSQTELPQATAAYYKALEKYCVFIEGYYAEKDLLEKVKYMNILNLSPINDFLEAIGAKAKVVQRVADKFNDGKTDLVYKILGGRSKNFLIAVELLKETQETKKTWKKMQKEIDSLII